ncbi:MAG: NAD-dependent epimerase/dehydratase family protein [Nitrospinaceae bacterium]
MNILVTGGAGFIGSHLVDGYLKAGHKVAVLDNLASGRREFISPKATFFEGDLLTADLKGILRREKIEVINHHAAQMSVEASIKDPVFDAKSNIIGTLQLLENAISSGVKKFIFASSGGAMYGDLETLPAGEDLRPRPVSPYAISKLSVENYLQFYSGVHGLSSIVLRYSNVFGPRQNPHGEAGVVAIHCHRLTKGKPPLIYGDGEQTRDFISVKDLVPVNLAALHPDLRGIFNVGTGRETTVKALTETLVRLSGRQASIDLQPARPGELRRSAIDPGKIRERCGWQPKHSLEEGLLETFRYFDHPEA